MIIMSEFGSQGYLASSGANLEDLGMITICQHEERDVALHRTAQDQLAPTVVVQLLLLIRL